MKPLFLFLTVIISTIITAQDTTPNKYLLVRFYGRYDKVMKREYYMLWAEYDTSIAKYAKKIYALKTYEPVKKQINEDSLYYYNQKTDVDSLYNYFLTITEGLNFIAKYNWQLLTTYIDVGSGHEERRALDGPYIPITTIASKPVFIFKKK